MTIVFDHPGFKKAISSFFKSDVARNICVVEDGKLLAGCGFSKVKDGKTYAFLLRLHPAWASKEFYGALLRFPFEQMGAEQCIARVASNQKSTRVCEHLGGVRQKDEAFLFEKAKALKDSVEVFEYVE